MNKIYGYVRVSSADQNEDRQMLAMQKMGVAEQSIFMDKQSGKYFEHPNYKKSERCKVCRPEVSFHDDFGETVKMWEKGQITFGEVLSHTKMKEATFYRRLREYRLLVKIGNKI